MRCCVIAHGTRVVYIYIHNPKHNLYISEYLDTIKQKSHSVCESGLIFSHLPVSHIELVFRFSFISTLSTHTKNILYISYENFLRFHICLAVSASKCVN